MNGIDNKELIIALEELEKEKNISKEYLLESIDIALVTAYKKNFDSIENVKINMDKVTGFIHVYSVKEICEVVEDSNLQISIAEAQKINKNLQLGDTVDIEIIPKNFGRIAAQTAKQVIIQKLREAERTNIFEEYSERKGEIISGIIQKADGNTVILDLGKLEGILPLKEQIPTDKYNVNEKLKAYVLNVEIGNKKVPQVLLSRSNVDFVRKLFEIEIPEIYEGVIEIKSIARDAGNRSKVAVYSGNENIDPVGSCVGQKGIRIQNIINELNGEKIDVIEWNSDPVVFITFALLPATVISVDVNEETREARVIVPDDQLSLAIGKSGQNARLAAKLTNWKIDIKSESNKTLETIQNNVNDEDEIESDEIGSDID